jgi:hypothetical protein
MCASVAKGLFLRMPIKKRSPSSLKTRRSFCYFVDGNRSRVPQRFVVAVTKSVNGETLVAETARTR